MQCNNAMTATDGPARRFGPERPHRRFAPRARAHDPGA